MGPANGNVCGRGRVLKKFIKRIKGLGVEFRNLGIEGLRGLELGNSGVEFRNSGTRIEGFGYWGIEGWKNGFRCQVSGFRFHVSGQIIYEFKD